MRFPIGTAEATAQAPPQQHLRETQKQVKSSTEQHKK
jgi:hypothetical protein